MMDTVRERETAGAYEPRLSVQAVRSATGRDWEEWFAVLDAWGAEDRGHGEIAGWLAAEHRVGSWWTQAVTVEYERARGLRSAGSGRDGQFSASASRTIGATAEQVSAAFTDAALRSRWLPEGMLRLRTAQPGRSARFDWGDGATRVLVGFTAKGDRRTQVALVHERLPEAEAAEERKVFWRARLGELKALLEA